MTSINIIVQNLLPGPVHNCRKWNGMDRCLFAVIIWVKRNTCTCCLLSKYVVFMRNFTYYITVWYRPKPFISGAIENKVKKRALRFCARSNLWLLSFSDPEYRSLQACFNIEMPSWLIFEPLAPRHLDVTRRWTVNISCISADICAVLTNAHANRIFARSFLPRNPFVLQVYKWYGQQWKQWYFL